MYRLSPPNFPPPLHWFFPPRKLSGVDRLMLAVVGTAVDDLLGSNPWHREQALRYFFSDVEFNVLSFPSICRHFDWSLSLLRTQLRAEVKDGVIRKMWRSFTA